MKKRTGYSVLGLPLLLTGCAMFQSEPAGESWNSQIESYSPDTDASAVAGGAGELSQSNSGFPAGLTGPNPQVASNSLLEQASKLLPGNSQVTEALPTQTLTGEESVSVAQPDASGWLWNDRARRWEYVSRQMPTTEDWLYEPEALVFRFNALEALNVFEGANHATVVKVIQLSSPTEFNTLRQSSFGIADMLTQTAMSSSFVSERRVHLEPLDSLSMTLDREEGSKYIGLLAGYYELGEYKTVSRLIQIPAVAESLESGTLSRFWPLGEDPVLQRPARLKFWVELGSEMINDVVIQVF